MISKQKQLFYFVGDKPYASLEEAQKVDLMAMMPISDGPGSWSNECIADWMLKHSQEIVDTLTTTPRSRLRGRKLHGGTRKPRATKTKSNEATKPTPA